MSFRWHLFVLQVSVDRADRLPWHGFTQVTVCVSPPAALYQVGPANVLLALCVLCKEKALWDFTWSEEGLLTIRNVLESTKSWLDVNLTASINIVKSPLGSHAKRYS